MDVDNFLAQAGGRGACIGTRLDGSPPLAVASDVELRMIDGGQARNMDAVYSAFAEVWHFPPWFGRNSSAFDDFMRDLDNMIEVASRKPSASAYLTNIVNAHLFLSEQPELLSWFAECIPFYRDYYRDENGMYRDKDNKSAAFGVILTVPAGELPGVRERWSAVGAQLATVD